MLKNLIAEMARNNMSYKDIAEIFGRDEKSISNKISCKTEFTRKEMMTIKKEVFHSCILDYLFEQTGE